MPKSMISWRNEPPLARLLMFLLLAAIPPALAQPSDDQPVKVVSPQRLAVSTATGQGQLPIFLSADWSAPMQAVIRAIVVLHGTLRNADAYLRDMEQARAEAGASEQSTLLIVPQFLADPDIAAHTLSPDTLRWSLEGWKDGEPATGPAPISSFDALDAVLARLADTTLFPALHSVVVAGHSAGAQVVQRYAIAGRGEAALTARGITVRYVIANPSSYLWFGNMRPGPLDPATCPQFDRWKYAGCATRRLMWVTPASSKRASSGVMSSICWANRQQPEPSVSGPLLRGHGAGCHAICPRHGEHAVPGTTPPEPGQAPGLRHTGCRP